jgi:hypothetical protein
MTFLLRFGAVSGVLCGLFLGLPGAVEAVTGETALTSIIIGLSPGLAAPLLIALYLGQLPAGGRLASVGYAVNLIGLGLFGGGAYALNIVVFFLDESVAEELAGPSRVVLLASALVFVVGSLLFGIAMLRARIYPRVPAWGYTVLLPVFAVAATLPESLLNSILHLVTGGALGWLAVTLPRTVDRPQPGR